MLYLMIHLKCKCTVFLTHYLKLTFKKSSWSPNAYQQMPQQVDFFGNPIQSQPTGGFAMADMSSLQPQMTSYNPFQQQQEALAMQQQQQMLLQQQQQQQQQQQAMFNNMLSPQPLEPQKTGYRSNNPFATHLTGNAPVRSEVTPSPQPSTPAIPSNFGPHSLHSRPSMPNLSTSTSAEFNKPAINSTPPRNPGLNLKTNDSKHEHLANALANGSGVDTFGNEGLLRVPTGAAKFAPQVTGSASPFGASMPSSVTGSVTGGGGGAAFGAQAQSAFSQPQIQKPNNNPWATSANPISNSPFTQTPPQQQQQQQQQQQTETPFFTL